MPLDPACITITWRNQQCDIASTRARFLSSLVFALHAGVLAARRGGLRLWHHSAAAPLWGRGGAAHAAPLHGGAAAGGGGGGRWRRGRDRGLARWGFKDTCLHPLAATGEVRLSWGCWGWLGHAACAGWSQMCGLQQISNIAPPMLVAKQQQTLTSLSKLADGEPGANSSKPGSSGSSGSSSSSSEGGTTSSSSSSSDEEEAGEPGGTSSSGDSGSSHPNAHGRRGGQPAGPLRNPDAAAAALELLQRVMTHSRFVPTLREASASPPPLPPAAHVLPRPLQSLLPLAELAPSCLAADVAGAAGERAALKRELCELLETLLDLQVGLRSGCWGGGCCCCQLELGPSSSTPLSCHRRSLRENAPLCFRFYYHSQWEHWGAGELGHLCDMGRSGLPEAPRLGIGGSCPAGTACSNSPCLHSCGLQEVYAGEQSGTAPAEVQQAEAALLPLLMAGARCGLGSSTAAVQLVAQGCCLGMLPCRASDRHTSHPCAYSGQLFAPSPSVPIPCCAMLRCAVLLQGTAAPSARRTVLCGAWRRRSTCGSGGAHSVQSRRQARTASGLTAAAAVMKRMGRATKRRRATAAGRQWRRCWRAHSARQGECRCLDKSECGPLVSEGLPWPSGPLDDALGAQEHGASLKGVTWLSA